MSDLKVAYGRMLMRLGNFLPSAPQGTRRRALAEGEGEVSGILITAGTTIESLCTVVKQGKRMIASHPRVWVDGKLYENLEDTAQVGVNDQVRICFDGERPRLLVVTKPKRRKPRQKAREK